MTSRLDGALFQRGAFAIAIASLFSVAPAFALPAGGVGVEFRVNAHTEGDQVSPSIAHSANGDFVVAWADYSEDVPGIHFRRYFADGTVRDRRPVRVDTPDEFSVTPPHSPDIAMDEDGDFVIAWLDLDTRVGPGEEYFTSTIFARRFAASGRPRDSSAREIARSGNVNRTLGPPSVAMDALGDFAVAYDEADFGGARFVDSCHGVFVSLHARGGRRISRSRVGTEICSFSPTLAMEPDGDFVIAFVIAQTNPRSGDFVSARLVANRYHSSGDSRDKTPAVVAPGKIFSETGDIAVEADGDFIVTWSNNLSGYPVVRSDIMARRFTSGGVLRGPVVQVNADSDGLNEAPRIGIAGDGSFTVVWERETLNPDDKDIFRRAFDSRARPADSGDIKVNAFTTDFQIHPALSVNGDGSFVVAWESAGEQDGSGEAVYAVRHDGPPSPPIVSFEAVGQRALENAGAARVAVTLSRPSSADVSVPLILSGTATDGQDYQLSTRSVLIPAGQTRVLIAVTISNDGAQEPDESIGLKLGKPLHAAKGSSGNYHRVTIVDDD